MKKLVTISLYLGALFCLVGCEGWYNPQVPDLSTFGDKTAFQIYQESEAAFQDKEYNKAIRGFKALNRLHHNNVHAQAAYTTLIDCYLAANQFDDAIQAIDTLIRLYPDSVDLPKLQYKKQVIRIALIDYQAEQGNFQDAIQAINRFIRLYPYSQHVRSLQRKKELLKHQQEIQDLKSQHNATLALYAVDKVTSNVREHNTRARHREEIRRMRRDFDNRTRWENLRRTNRRA